jgi:hypothetical protein
VGVEFPDVYAIYKRMVPLNALRHLEALAFLEEFPLREPWGGIGPLQLHRM